MLDANDEKFCDGDSISVSRLQFTRLKAGSRFVVMYEQSETMTSRGEVIMCAATLRPSVEKRVCKVGLNSSMR